MYKRAVFLCTSAYFIILKQSIVSITLETQADENLSDPIHNKCKKLCSFCAIFASNDKGANHVKSLTNLRRVVTDTMETDEQLSDWLKFFYIIDRKQEAFVKALSGMEELPRDPAVRSDLTY